MTISTLAQLIACIESSNNPQAVRYEPAHDPKPEFIALLVKAINCSEATAKMFCMCSWGLFQIMGDELVSQGFRGWPGDYTSNTDVQYLHFNEFLKEANIDYTLNNIINDPAIRLSFATRYNGPDDAQAYADRMLAVYKENA
jgi:hypothetical protein